MSTPQIAPYRKLGMQPKSHDEHAFLLRSFLDVAQAKVPKSHTRHLSAGQEWLMLGNDSYGDCADVARAHGLMVMAHTERKKFAVTGDQVVKDYLGYTGGQDVGTDPDELMALWRRSGPWGTEPITAYLSVGLSTAVVDIPRVDYLFGSCYLCFALPSAIEPAWGAWPVPPTNWKTDSRWAPYSWGGHMVMSHGFTSKGVKIVTWGQGDWFVPWEFVRAYLVGAYAVIHPMWFNKKARTPQGLDAAALSAELARL